MEWIEQIADCFVWFIPISAAIGLWLARLSSNQLWRLWTQRAFFALLLLVAGGTLRTVMVDDPSWLLHTLSLGVMVIGAACPTPYSGSIESFEF
ncbi:MAG: hypothetical protein SGI77_27210 [Pirellulaceae bacterium]|nr:hypothetical protein [Pirellulaceae bacterium]